jgi:hypothetical protein
MGISSVLMRLGLRARRSLLLAIMLVPALAHSQSQLSGNTSIESEMESLKNGTLCQRRSAIIALHRKGKQAIPTLISHIGDIDLADASADMLSNPILSAMPPESQNDYFVGVLYAYAVELILGRVTVSADQMHCDFLLDVGDYAYRFGIIRKKGDRPIAATDLPRIEQIYSRWWESNLHRTLAQMREDWKRSSRPLSGSQFSWQ